MEQKTTRQEVIAGGRTTGAFRCLNCFERVSPPWGAKTYKCPHCGFQWRIAWLAPDLPRIRGPVWDANRRLAREAISDKGKGKK